jgi:hypothetical protein
MGARGLVAVNQKNQAVFVVDRNKSDEWHLDSSFYEREQAFLPLRDVLGNQARCRANRPLVQIDSLCTWFSCLPSPAGRQ